MTNNPYDYSDLILGMAELRALLAEITKERRKGKTDERRKYNSRGNRDNLIDNQSRRPATNYQYSLF